MDRLPTFDDAIDAAAHLRGWAVETPLLRSAPFPGAG